MKKEIKISDPKFYLGHSTNPKYVEVECLFTCNRKLVWTLYLIKASKSKKDEYYLAEAKKLYQQELKSGKLARKARIGIDSHYYRNRNLIIGGGILLASGLIAMTVLLTLHLRPNYQTFDYFKKQDGTYEILKVNGNVENLVIPEQYNGVPVTSIADNAVKEHRELKTLQLSDNLQTIGAYAFFGDSSLESLTFPTSNAIPSLKIISSHAFGECYNLKDLYLPDGLNEIGSFAFQNNRAVKDLFIPWNVQKINSDAFNGCTNLTLYIERKEIPASWSTKWNSSNRPYILDSTRDTPGTLTIRDGLVFRKVVDSVDKKVAYAEIIKFDETAGALPDKELKIPATVEMGGVTLDVTSINENAFAIKPKGKVRWLVVPASITHVGANAFKALTNTLIFVEYNTDTTEWDKNWSNGVLKVYTDFIDFGDDTYGTKQKVKFASIDGIGNVLIDGESDSDGSLTLRGNTSYFTEIAPKAFAGRDDVFKVQTSGTGDTDLTLIDDFAFANCYNLKAIDFTSSKTLTIGSHAFYTTLYNKDNNGVTNIKINISNNKSLIIKESAFEKGYKTTTTGVECTEIEQLSITHSHISIGQSAFKGCRFKEGCSITLDDGCNKPGNYCFAQAGNNLTIHISNILLSIMINWGWGVVSDDVVNKLGLHLIDTNTYQLYTKVKPKEGDPYISYERLGQAKIVVSA